MTDAPPEILPDEDVPADAGLEQPDQEPEPDYDEEELV